LSEPFYISVDYGSGIEIDELQKPNVFDTAIMTMLKRKNAGEPWRRATLDFTNIRFLDASPPLPEDDLDLDRELNLE